jgi:hypothetical protein
VPEAPSGIVPALEQIRLENVLAESETVHMLVLKLV